MKWRGTSNTVVTLLAVAAGIAYLGARITTLGSGWTLVLSLPLYVAETLAFAQLGLFAFVGWHAHRHPDGITPARRSHRSGMAAEVDIVVDCGGLPADALERTLVGVRAVRSVSRTIVVDRFHREDLAETAAALGATYTVDDRPEEQWVEVLLETSSTHAVAWLRSGHVPMEDFIEAGYSALSQSKVAVWQSAVGLLNSDSFAHVQRGRDEDAVLRTVIAPGLNAFGAGPWNGSGSIVRRHALERLGAHGSTRSVPLAGRLMFLHRSGWSSVFASTPHVRSLAPDTLDDYLIERRDRARSVFALLASRHNPLVYRGLSAGQRLAHLALASPFLTGMRQAVVVLLLIPVLLTGVLPISGDLVPILGLWAIASSAAVLTRRLLAGDSMRIGDWTRHGWRTVGADVAAAVSLLRPRPGDDVANGERVTGLRTLGRLRLLTGIVVALDLALLARGLTIVFETALPPLGTAEKLVVISFGLFALVPMIDVLHLVVARKQRRKAFRLDADLAVHVGDTKTRSLDVSTSGIGVLLPSAPVIGSPLRLRIDVPDGAGHAHQADLTGVVRAASREDSGQVRVGIEFADVPATTRRALIAFCMAGTTTRLDPGEIAEPHALTIHRPGGGRGHPLKALTAIASAASVAMLFVGPSAASASTTEHEAISINIVNTRGGGVEGAELRSMSAASEPWKDAGTTDNRGSATVQVAAGSIGRDGAAVEILWNGNRVVLPLRATTTVFTSRIDGDPANVVAVNTGDGWIDFIDGMHVLPGRVAVRFADGSVMKTELDPGLVLDTATGEASSGSDETGSTTTTTAPGTTTALSTTTAPTTVPSTTITTAPEAPRTSTPLETPSTTSNAVPTTGPPESSTTSAPETTSSIAVETP